MFTGALPASRLLGASVLHGKPQSVNRSRKVGGAGRGQPRRDGAELHRLLDLAALGAVVCLPALADVLRTAAAEPVFSAADQVVALAAFDRVLAFEADYHVGEVRTDERVVRRVADDCGELASA